MGVEEEANSAMDIRSTDHKALLGSAVDDGKAEPRKEKGDEEEDMIDIVVELDEDQAGFRDLRSSGHDETSSQEVEHLCHRRNSREEMSFEGRNYLRMQKNAIPCCHAKMVCAAQKSCGCAMKTMQCRR